MNKKQKVNSNKKSIFNPGILVLENKSIFNGIGIGYEGTATGEVCFNTSITGYQEIISDPSYAEQIITFTFPHIGNVGTNSDDNESLKPMATGIITRAKPTEPSNWRNEISFDLWLEGNNITGIYGIDTRALTRKIRDLGAPKAIINFDKNGEHDLKYLRQELANWPGIQGRDLTSKVYLINEY